MPICATCKGFHSVGVDCPQIRKVGIDHLFKAPDPAEQNPDQVGFSSEKRKRGPLAKRYKSLILFLYAFIL
jgi:hypothetical protein